MKRFSSLTKKERRDYINSVCPAPRKRQVEDAEIRYIIENNSVEEIAYWLRHEATTTIFPGTPADWITTVYVFNRLHEYCAEHAEG